MGRTRRCRAVVLGASVVALGAAGACPAASAAGEKTPGSRGPRAAIAHRHTASSRARRRGKYMYEAIIGAPVSTTQSNMFCSGSVIRFVGVNLVGEGTAASVLWERTPGSATRRYTLTTGPATTITVPWATEAEKREATEHGGTILNSRDESGTAPASRVCAATAPDAGIGSVGEGVVTWRLAAPARSIAALLAQPPANVNMNELATNLEIEPDGNVPPVK